MINEIVYTGPKNGGRIMELSELFSRAETSDELDIPVITLKRWHANGRFRGIPVGQRPSGGAHVIVYTRRMLDAAKDGRYPIKPTGGELNSVMGKADVVAYAELSDEYVHSHTHIMKDLPSKVVGGTAVYIRRDVDKFVRTMRPRIQVVGGMVGDYDLAAPVLAYRQAHGISQQMLADAVGLARQTLGQLELRRDLTLKSDVYGRLTELINEENNDETIQ